MAGFYTFPLPELAPGQTVRCTLGLAEVVDCSDKSLVTIRLESGAVVRVGRCAVRVVGSAPTAEAVSGSQLSCAR